MRKVCITKLADHVLDCLAIQEVPFIKGSPGIGKSAMFAKIAETLNLEFIDFRLSMCDQTTLNGFPIIKDGRSDYAPPVEFPLVDAVLPKGKDGWLISFEEINSAPPSIQAIAYRILHDRKIGNTPLHEKVYMVANGNLDSDRAVTNPMSTALASRMVQYQAYINPENWLEWAFDSELFHPIVLDYLTYKKENVHNFNPSNADPAFPCPRTHEKVSKLLHLSDKNKQEYTDRRVSIEGSIGEATASDLFAFIEHFKSIIPLQDVIGDKKVEPHVEPGVRFATAINTINNIDTKDINAVCKAIKHFKQPSYGIEMPILVLKRLFRRDPKLIMARDPAFATITGEYEKYLKKD